MTVDERVDASGPEEGRPPTERVRVRRLPRRAAYDRATIDAILDAGLIAHLGFVVDGQPYVIPTLHARVGDDVLVHGSSASRALGLLGNGDPIALTVTLVDGIVLARSAFHHSINYRSVVVLGRATVVDDHDARLAALEAFTERLAPGRWAEVRQPTEKELRATTIVRIPISEASAKLRSGPPVDDPEDVAIASWAGVLPLAVLAGRPQPAPDLAPGTAVSPSVRALAERFDLGR